MLAYKLVEARKARGLSGYRLAKMAGFTAQHISLIEHGLRIPGEEGLARIAEALNLPAEQVVAWADASRIGRERVIGLTRWVDVNDEAAWDLPEKEKEPVVHTFSLRTKVLDDNIKV